MKNYLIEWNFETYSFHSDLIRFDNVSEDFIKGYCKALESLSKTKSVHYEEIK